MSIFLDPRSGSGELTKYFSPYDVPLEPIYLDAGDFMFCGNGPDGVVKIGYERKVLTDLIASMRSERFAGEQLKKLLDNYDYISILVEGEWRAGPGGSIEVKGQDWKTKKWGWVPMRLGSSGGILFREVDHWLATLEHVVGGDSRLTVIRTMDEAQTAATIVSRYKWWNDKEWDDHKSFRAIYSPDVPNPPGRKGFSLPTPGPVEEVSCRFPGVREKAWAFGEHFDDVIGMVNATEKELARVPGIGKKGAGTIYAWLRKRKNGHNSDGGWTHD